MKKFREYLSEEMQPFAHTEKGFVGVDNNAVRDNINLILANVTSSSYATPYHAIEMIRKALAPFHISLPATLFLDGEYGHEVFEINQFGEKSGVTDSGEVITLESSPYFIYFEYDMNDKGSFEIFSEIVNADELNEIMSEVDDELEDEEELDEEAIDECWEGYRQQGTKMKGGRQVPNCVPVNEEQLDEISLKTKIKAYGAASDVDADYNYGSKVGAQADRIRAAIVKKHGAKAGEHADDHADTQNYGRQTRGRHKVPAKLTGHKIDKDTLSGGTNPYGILSTDKRTKSGTIPKNTQKGMANVIRNRKVSGPKKKLPEETQINELSPATLGSYIKKRSHDVAAKSAAVRGFARDADAQRKAGKPMDARKSDERADKMFKKSWKHREGIAKAVDKLTKEDTVNEASVGKLVLYKNKAGEGREAGIKLAQKKLTGKAKVNATAPKHAYMEQMSPGRAGEIAAGRKGSNPAEQGSIAVKRDDERRERKTNFNVAKNLAKKAMKAQIKKAKEKK